MVQRRKETIDLETQIATYELAELLGVSDPRIRQLVAEKVLKPGERNSFHLKRSVQAYIAFCRENKRATSTSAKKDALVEEQTRKLKLDNDLKEGALVDMPSVIDLAKIWAGAVQSELANWPARATRDEALRAVLEKEVAASLERIRRTVERATNELLAFGDETADEVEEYAELDSE